MKETRCNQISLFVVGVNQTIRYIKQNGETTGKNHQFPRHSIIAKLWWSASWHAIDRKARILLNFHLIVKYRKKVNSDD